METGIFDRGEIIQLWALALVMFANLFMYVLHKVKGKNASPFTWTGFVFKVFLGVGAWILLLVAASGLNIQWSAINHDNPYLIVICLQYGANAEVLVGAYFQQWVEKKVAERRVAASTVEKEAESTEKPVEKPAEDRKTVPTEKTDPKKEGGS